MWRLDLTPTAVGKAVQSGGHASQAAYLWT